MQVVVPLVALVAGVALSAVFLRAGLRKESSFEKFRAWSMALLILVCTLIPSFSELFKALRR